MQRQTRIKAKPSQAHLLCLLDDTTSLPLLPADDANSKGSLSAVFERDIIVSGRQSTIAVTEDSSYLLSLFAVVSTQPVARVTILITPLCYLRGFAVCDVARISGSKSQKELIYHQSTR
mmetsp:Transcript_13222/g.24813  ORF Transcript_13222/g.24813 Transcript_13222/m.24813 type:complete len:119 (-) Transcript_13222:190-546(-)